MYCDAVVYKSVDSARCKDLLRQHVFEHIVSVRGRHYVQGIGVPQGSILSAALCNLYYGYLERCGPLQAFWRPTVGAAPPSPPATAPTTSSVLLRLTDDFLFITTDAQLATDFATVLHRGVPEFGCHVNPRKSLVNFNVVVTGEDGMTVAIPVTKTPFISWCGLLFNTTSLEVHASYQKCVSTKRESIVFSLISACLTRLCCVLLQVLLAPPCG